MEIDSFEPGSFTHVCNDIMIGGNACTRYIVRRYSADTKLP